ncbi:MAG: DUF418 domain-containing protein [Tannerellaceae bacterium]|nr:DUF418 domain-containing protein [Tannerellaceae bacterium]
MENLLTEKNNRVDVADVLRGLAVMGIIILHSIEHFNFYSFPDTTGQAAWLNFTDKAIWDSLFFTFGGKAYAVFALLFGFSFYIQDDNQQRRGNDFRLRFMWRLVLLFIIGNFNALFFTAEILVMYSIIGFILPLVCRFSTRTILILAIICLLQPLEWIKVLAALFSPDNTLLTINEGAYWKATMDAQTHAGFLEMCKVNLWEGQLASLAWAWNHGRIFQTAALFMLGFLMGRTKLLLYTPENRKIWFTLLAWSLICYFPLMGLANMLPGYIKNPEAGKSLVMICKSLANFCFMCILVVGVLWAFYETGKQQLLLKMAPYGKMSLTHYLGQSIIGSFFFYNWGLALYQYLGITASFIFGIALFAAQYLFSIWWFKHHTHGPFESIWKKATWITIKHTNNTNRTDLHR